MNTSQNLALRLCGVTAKAEQTILNGSETAKRTGFAVKKGRFSLFFANAF